MSGSRARLLRKAGLKKRRFGLMPTHKTVWVESGDYGQHTKMVIPIK